MEDNNFNLPSTSTSTDVASLANEIGYSAEKLEAYKSRLPPIPNVPDYLRELIVEKRYWMKNWRQTGDPTSGKRFNMYKKRVKTEIQNIRNQLELTKDLGSAKTHPYPTQYLNSPSNPIEKELCNQICEKLGEKFCERVAAFAKDLKANEGNVSGIFGLSLEYEDILVAFKNALDEEMKSQNRFPAQLNQA